MSGEDVSASSSDSALISRKNVARNGRSDDQNLPRNAWRSASSAAAFSASASLCRLSVSLQRHLTLLLRLPCLLLLFDLYPLLMRFFVVERQLLGEFVFAKLRELHLPLFLRSPLLGFKLLCLLLLLLLPEQLLLPLPLSFCLGLGPSHELFPH